MIRLCTSFPLIFFTVFSSFAQLSPVQQLDALAGRTIQAVRAGKQEQVYLQTDRSVYTVGDVLWFKAFVTDSLNKRLSRKSEVLYVDLVNEKDQVIKQLLLHAAQFKTDGGFRLSDTLTSGHYWLRAYTSNLLKSNTHGLFVHPVYLINSMKPDPLANHSIAGKEMRSVPADDSVRIRFFPEGGTVVGGAAMAMVIQAMDAAGEPLVVTGTVKDNYDSVVALVRTNAAGLAKIDFFSWNWRRYTLHLHHPGRIASQYTLPPINPHGGQLAVLEKNGSRRLRILLEDSLKMQNRTTFLLGFSGDSLCFSAVGKDSYELNIPEYQFPKGVATFLLFDAQEKLLSTRSLFIETRNEPQVQLIADKLSYVAREKVQLSVQVADETNKPQVASFYVEVKDVSRASSPVNTASPDSIPSSTTERDWWLLTRDGSPYKEMAQSVPGIQPEGISEKEDSLFYIQGKIQDARGRPMVDKIITIYGDGKNKIFLTDTTDASGRFSFPFSAYDEGTRVSLQTTDLWGALEPAKMKLDTLWRFPSVATPSHLKRRFPFEVLDTIRKALVVQLAKDTALVRKGKEWLADVTVKGIIRKDPGYDEKKRISQFSHLITGDALRRFGGNDVGNALFRVAGIHLRNGFVTVRGGNSFKLGPSTEPMIVMDGVPIPIDTTGSNDIGEASPVLGYLRRLSAETIDFMEVLTGAEAAIYGVRGGNGVIALHTKNRLDAVDPNMVTGIRNLILKGFHVPEVFAQPDYSLRENKLSKLPDVRSIIYWNGDLVTDATGKATITFYTADAPATYAVTLAGITANGAFVKKELLLNRK